MLAHFLTLELKYKNTVVRPNQIIRVVVVVVVVSKKG